jgi:hypothetical protein
MELGAAKDLRDVASVLEKKAQECTAVDCPSDTRLEELARLEIKRGPHPEPRSGWGRPKQSREGQRFGQQRDGTDEKV